MGRVLLNGELVMLVQELLRVDGGHVAPLMGRDERCCRCIEVDGDLIKELDGVSL